MKLIILGSKGMLGQYLVDVFKDHEVFGFDKDSIDITDRDSLKEKN